MGILNSIIWDIFLVTWLLYHLFDKLLQNCNASTGDTAVLGEAIYIMFIYPSF